MSVRLPRNSAHRVSRVSSRRRIAQACIEAFETRRLLASPDLDAVNPHGGECFCAGCRPANLNGAKSVADLLRENAGAVNDNEAGVRAPLSSLPALSSRPGAPVTMHLDFDGTPSFEFNASTGLWASGPAPGNNDPIQAFTIDGNVNDFNSAELDAINVIWRHVSEKFSPFNINVTTVPPPNYNDGVAVHMIIAGSDADWYMQGAGGVAPLNGFTNGRPNSGFCFSADAITAGSVTLSANDRHFIAETVAHEAGHLFGLEHQSVVSGSTVTVEYSNGDANTAPIMGNSSNNSGKRGIWNNGPASRRDNNNNLISLGNQNDLDVLTRPGNFITYRPDDFGSFSGSGSLLVDTTVGLASGGGVIETNGDQDAFTFVAIGPVLQFTVTNFAEGGMLAPTLELIPISGNTPTVSLTTTNTSATITTSNATPGQGFVLRVGAQGGAYGSLGQYRITGSVGAFAGMSGGTLVINGYTIADDLLISYNISQDKIVVQNDVLGGSGVQQFARGPVTGILVNGNDGNDFIDVLGQISSLNIPITVNGNAGTDTLILEGTTGNDYQALTGNRGFITNAMPGTYNTMEAFILSAFDGADTFEIYETAAGTNTTVYGSNGNDSIRVGAQPFAGLLVQGNVTVAGDADNDTLYVGANNADSVLGTITFTGGTNVGGLNDRLIYEDTAVGYSVDYDVRTSSVIRDGLFNPVTVNYFTTEEVVINAGSSQDSVIVRNAVSPIVRAFGNGGNDIFTRGDGMLSASSGAQFDGGPGVDQITFDDRNNPGNIIFDCRPNEVIYGGLIIQQTAGFESVGILAGTGANEITFTGTLAQNFAVDAGPGGDTIIFGFNGGTAVIQGSVDVQGGDGSDAFVVNSTSTSGSGAIALNGGNSLNSLTVTRPGTLVYDLAGGQIDLYSFGSQALMGVANFDSTTINGNSLNETFNITGAASVFQLYRVFGNDGNDLFNVFPVGASPYVFDNLYCNGGNGTDQFVYTGNAAYGGLVYRVANNAIRLDNGILDDAMFIETNVENVTLNAGGGDDTIFVDQYSAGSNLRIRGGAGNDLISLGGNNFQTNLTNAASFNVDGEGGTDEFRINNASNANPWTYRVSTGTVVTETPITSPITPATYSWTSGIAGLEKITVNAGTAGDAMRVSSLGSGVGLDFNAAAGLDQLFLGEGPLNIGLIAGPIFFNTGPNAGRLVITDQNATSAKTVHMDANSVGAYPGDNLFGAGGSLRFTDLVDLSSFFPAMTLTMGPFADTIFAQPLATGRVSIDGRAPTTAPGDTLNLALAGADNYIINAGVNGSVTSSNLQTLSWFGIEAPIGVDDASPVVANQGFIFVPGAPRGVPPMSFTASFSEDVSAFLTPSVLELFNATTGTPVPAGDIAVTWDAATLTATFSFPNYVGGLLPDGVYQARILAGLVDSFGNPGGDGPYYTFVWSGGTSGNDAFRVALNPATLDYEIYLNDDVTPAFLAGQGTARFVLAGRGGDDTLVVDASNGDPLPPQALLYDGGEGSDHLAVRGSTGADVTNFDINFVTVNAGGVDHAGVESFKYDGGGGAAFDALVVVVGRVGFARSQRLSELTVFDGAAVELPSSGDNAIYVRGLLQTGNGGRIDLGGGAMIVDYEPGNSPIASIRSLLISGRDGGTWGGPGIASSTAALDPSAALGYAEATDLFGTFPATFVGEDVDETAILLRHTLLGDANLDRAVGIGDFSALAANFNQPTAAWSRGDFDYSGTTGIGDFSALASNFNGALPLARSPLSAAGRDRGGSTFGATRIGRELPELL